MAIKIYEKFAPRANPADGDYPYGSIKNESVPGAKDGTPLDAAWGNDMVGFTDALLAEAGIVPSGLADTVNNSQRVDAIRAIAGIMTFGNVDEMLGFSSKIIGRKYSTGETVWRYAGNTYGDIRDFQIINKLHVADYSNLVAGDKWDAPINRAVSDYKLLQALEPQPSIIVFPSIRYRVDSVTFTDLYDTTLDMNNGIMQAASTTVQIALFRVINYNNLKIINLGTLFSFNNANYSYGMLFVGGAGGTIDPVNGLGKELTISGGTILRFARGIKIGNETLDVNHGQNTISKVHIKECNQGLIAAGSQTIVSVSCGTIGSGGADIYGIPDNEKIGVITYGAVVVINSAETLKTSGLGYGIGISNSTSSLYSYPYGSVIVNGSYLETTSIARIFSIGGAIPRTSNKSTLNISSATGGVSGAGNIAVVCNADDYEGTVSLTNSNMYGFGGTRTAKAVDMGPSTNAVVKLENFFRKPFFGNKLSEVVSGVLLLDNHLIARAENLAGQTVTTVGDTLKFSSKLTSGNFARYSSDYNTSTGVFTVPNGGFDELRVECSISSNTFAGVVRVLVNGTSVFNFYTALRGDISTTLRNLQAGDTVSIKCEPSANVTFGSSALDYIQFFATKREE